MVSYAILANPGHNRVYFETSKALALSELSLALARLGLPAEPAGAELGGVYYVRFDAPKRLSDAELAVIARLSFVYALFELEGEGEGLRLAPALLPPVQYISSSISGILKYSGKTNELFTRLLINAALLSTSFPAEDIRLLDPVAGKGTTLFDGLSLGFDCCGVELSERSVNEGYTYLKKYLETEKLKHTTGTEKINLAKGDAAHRLFAEIARSKDEQKNGQTKHFELVCASSANADRLYKKNSFHIIAGDLPYGVQHGNVAGTPQKGSSPTRNPKELINACAGAWYTVLKPGGAMALSWNSFVFSREEFAKLLEAKGFTVQQGGAYERFEHRVDQSIRRDIIVAKKPN